MQAKDAMSTVLHRVAPSMSIVELERFLLSNQVSGVPVVERGKLVGVVSRTDIVKMLSAAQSYSEYVSDYYHDYNDSLDPRTASEALAEIGERVGARMERWEVRDAMSSPWGTVAPEAPIEEVARFLVQHRIHRVLVTTGDDLLGIVTSFDLVRLVAEGRLRPAS